MLGIGLCGALTTFSTLQLEALQFADNDHALLGAAYAATSIATGLLVAYAVTSRTARMGPGPARAVGEPEP
jgi:CrcB protein